MKKVVDLAEWRANRQTPPGGDRDPASGRDRDGVARLDRAVERLSQVVLRAGSRNSAVDAGVETELLAIMGEVSMGLFGAAAERAERLAARLALRYEQREG